MTSTRSDLSQDDSALVRRVQTGDREAFGDLVERHQRRVWLVCRQYVGPDDADSTAQDAFVKAYTKLGKFDGRAAFSTWLTRIAINTCLDEIRRRRREGVRVQPTQDSEGDGVLETVEDMRAGPEQRAIERQAVGRLKACEARLPQRQREIFRLRFYAEMDLETIAATLGVHVGTIKTQLHRAVHRLRVELGETR